MTEILQVIDPGQLTVEAAETIRICGSFLAAGLSYRRIAVETGRSEDWVATRVQLLRRELILQAAAGARELSEGLRRRVEEARSEIERSRTAQVADGEPTPAPPTASPAGHSPTAAPAEPSCDR